MKLRITYDEIHDFIQAKYNQELNFQYLEKNTIKTMTKVSVPVPVIGRIEKNIELATGVSKVTPDEINLDYKTTTAIDTIINGAISLLNKKFPYLYGIDNHIVIKYREIPELQKYVKLGSLEDISFDEYGVKISIVNIDFQKIDELIQRDSK